MFFFFFLSSLHLKGRLVSNAWKVHLTTCCLFTANHPKIIQFQYGCPQIKAQRLHIMSISIIYLYLKYISINWLKSKVCVSVQIYGPNCVCVRAYMCIKLLLTLCGLEKKKTDQFTPHPKSSKNVCYVHIPPFKINSSLESSK